MSVMIGPYDDETLRFLGEMCRMLTLVWREHKQQGRQLVATPDIRLHMRRANNVIDRARRGERLMTRQEHDSIRQLSEWLVQKHHELHGTEFREGTPWVNPLFG